MTYRLVLSLLAAIIVSGCVNTFKISKAGKPVYLTENIQVTPSADWNRFETKNFEHWTLDGTSLQVMMIFKGVSDGSPLFPRNMIKDKAKRPPFQKDMTPIEIMELLEVEYSAGGSQKYTTEGMRPYKLAGLDGFRFEYSFIIQNGLLYKGLAAGVVEDEKLYMVTYQGADMHYFDHGLQHVESILKSMTFEKADDAKSKTTS